MDRNSDWSRWLAALADPGCALEITHCGRMRHAGWDMGRRILPQHMLHLVREGGHSGSVGGRTIRTGPGDCLWVFADQEQILRQREDVRWFSMSNLRFTLAAEPPPMPSVVRGAAVIGTHLDALRREWLACQSNREVRMRALLVLLFSEVHRIAGHDSSGLEAADQAMLLELIDRDPKARLHPAHLARHIGMTPTWFARRFRRTYGCSPRTWLVRRRIERAAEQLGSARSIGAVARVFGYADLFLFSRQFRSVLGVSPRAWLMQHRNERAVS